MSLASEQHAEIDGVLVLLQPTTGLLIDDAAVEGTAKRTVPDGAEHAGQSDREVDGIVNEVVFRLRLIDAVGIGSHLVNFSPNVVAAALICFNQTIGEGLNLCSQGIDVSSAINAHIMVHGLIALLVGILLGAFVP